MKTVVILLVAFAAIGMYIAQTKFHCHDAAFTMCHTHQMSDLFHGHE